MTCGIYKITNLNNKKVYIGQSTYIERRWSNHRTNAFNQFSGEYNSYLHRGFRKHGLENFSFEILEECKVDELNNREVYWIKHYSSFLETSGYNVTLGGSSSSGVKLNIELVEDISNLLLNTDLLNREIAIKYDVSENTIVGINTGYYWKRDIDYPIRKRKKDKENYCVDCGTVISIQGTRCKSCAGKQHRLVKERPDAETLLELVALHGFSAVGRMYGVSDNAVKKWCKSYGLPHFIKPIKEMYYKK